MYILPTSHFSTKNFGYSFSYPNLTLESVCQNRTGDFSNHIGKFLFLSLKLRRIELRIELNLQLSSKLTKKFAVSFK